MQFNGKNKREHFRVRYPVSCRPTLKIESENYDLIDISENGVRFLYKNEKLLHPGLDIDAIITFQDKMSLKVEGRVIRLNKRFTVAIMALKESLPMNRIIQEQRFIMEHYPEFLKE